MCSPAPAVGGPHLLPEQEEQAALQQEGQEGSVSIEEGGEGRLERLMLIISGDSKRIKTEVWCLFSPVLFDIEERLELCYKDSEMKACFGILN